MASLTAQAERTWFHDAGLERCVSEGDSLRLELENIIIDVDKGEYYSPVVTLSGVREIRRFDVPVAQLTMGGEVLQFRRGEGRALLLVEWHTYQPTTRIFVQAASVDRTRPPCIARSKQAGDLRNRPACPQPNQLSGVGRSHSPGDAVAAS